MERAPFRLAFRSEGEFVKCYYAAPDTMDKAMLLGSMRRSVFKVPDVFQQWQALMQQILAAACVEALGAAPEFQTEVAPEHERSGRA